MAWWLYLLLAVNFGGGGDNDEDWRVQSRRMTPRLGKIMKDRRKWRQAHDF